MTTQPPRRVPDDVAATQAEIAAAIEALTPGDWARLKLFADYRIRKLGPKAKSMTGDDLSRRPWPISWGTFGAGTKARLDLWVC